MARPPVRLKAITDAAKLAAKVPGIPDENTNLEKIDLATAQKIESLSGQTQDRTERKIYASRVFWMACLWLAGVMILILLQGFKVCGFTLDEGIFKGILWLTTAKIIAILWLVYKYLFSEKRIK